MVTFIEFVAVQNAEWSVFEMLNVIKMYLSDTVLNRERKVALETQDYEIKSI